MNKKIQQLLSVLFKSQLKNTIKKQHEAIIGISEKRVVIVYWFEPCWKLVPSTCNQNIYQPHPIDNIIFGCKKMSEIFK